MNILILFNIFFEKYKNQVIKHLQCLLDLLERGIEKYYLLDFLVRLFFKKGK